MLEYSLTMYGDETTVIYVSFLIHQVHTNDSMLFCIDIGAQHFRIGEKALERIFRHSGRRYIPIIDSKRFFKFGDTLVRSRGMIDQMPSTSGSTLHIPVIRDAEDV